MQDTETVQVPADDLSKFLRELVLESGNIETSCMRDIDWEMPKQLDVDYWGTDEENGNKVIEACGRMVGTETYRVARASRLNPPEYDTIEHELRFVIRWIPGRCFTSDEINMRIEGA